MMINWSNYVDHIYCLHFLPYQDRLPRLIQELKRVGILDSGIFQWFYSFRSIMDEWVKEKLPRNPKVLFDRDVPRAASQWIFHNLLYHDILALNYKRVLIIEDDAAFFKDLDKLKDMLEHLPDDWDFLKLDKTICPQYEYMRKSITPGKYFGSDYHGGYWGAGMMGVSARACPVGIAAMEKELLVTDQIWENRNDLQLEKLKRFVATENMVRQYGSSYNWAYVGITNDADYNL